VATFAKDSNDPAARNDLKITKMIQKLCLSLFITMTIFHSATAQPYPTKIRHTVVFKLNHESGSAQEKDFFAALDKLAGIQGVENFKVMKEISMKNSFDYILTMDFSGQKAYDHYNMHPEHVAFVQNVWLKEVRDFMEIDYEITD
jgi:hypothetical protein